MIGLFTFAQFGCTSPIGLLRFWFHAVLFYSIHNEIEESSKHDTFNQYCLNVGLNSKFSSVLRINPGVGAIWVKQKIGVILHKIGVPRT